MSNLDFLLHCTDFVENKKIEEDGKIKVKGIFYGSEDLSWTELEYVFDKKGNYISHKELDSHY